MAYWRSNVVIFQHKCPEQHKYTCLPKIIGDKWGQIPSLLETLIHIRAFWGKEAAAMESKKSTSGSSSCR